MSEYKELEAALKIDRMDLDREVEEQPTLFHKAGDMAALARSDADKAKAYVDELEGAMATKLREKALEFDKKLTEAAIMHLIKSDPGWIEANHDYLALKHEAARWDNLRESHKQRSHMLTNLKDLYVAGYYQQEARTAYTPREDLDRAARLRFKERRAKRK